MSKKDKLIRIVMYVSLALFTFAFAAYVIYWFSVFYEFIKII